MAKKVSGIALAMVAVLALSGTASAASSTLSPAAAQKLAKRLAHKQIHSRNIVAFQIAKEHRVKPNRIVFAYADRSRSHVYCTAVIEVTRSGVKEEARFTGASCRAIPTDGLAVELITQQAIGAVTVRRPAVRSSIAFFQRSLRGCTKLKVPRRVRAEVAALGQVGVVEALEGPVDAPVGIFVANLDKVQTADPQLKAAIAGWNGYLRDIRALPRLTNTCTAVLRWSKTGYSAGHAPIDFKALAALSRRTAIDSRAILAGSKKLAAEGIFARAALGFTPQGLLLQLHPRKLVIGVRR